MQNEGSRVACAGALLALTVLVACDGAPTEPPPLQPADAAVEFAQLARMGPADGTSGEMACPAGGTRSFEMTQSVEQDGDVTIHRTASTTVFDECGMQRGSSIIMTSGELTWTGESHLEQGGGKWPHGLLLRKSHQVGTLTMTYGDEVRTCEYDIMTVIEPAAGRYTYKGSVCGVAMDRTLPLTNLRVFQP